MKFAYTAIRVKNLNKSIKFYIDLFQMKIFLRQKVKQTNGEMAILKSGHSALELNFYKGLPYKTGDQLDHLAFEVKNLARFLTKLKSRKIRQYELLETDKWSRVFIKDPNGIWIEVYSMK